MNELPKGIVLFNKTVKCIHWKDAYSRSSAEEGKCPVKVECINGETFEADHVIVTIPLGMSSGSSFNNHSMNIYFLLLLFLIY